MNTANILAVADAIEQHTIPWLGFNLGPFFSIAAETREGDDVPVDRSGHNCGTVACIAGHAMILKHGVTNEPRSAAEADKLLKGDFLAEAAKFFELEYGSDTEDRAGDLFFAKSASRYRDEIPADQAVRTLRHLAATGTVDWTV